MFWLYITVFGMFKVRESDWPLTSLFAMAKATRTIEWWPGGVSECISDCPTEQNVQNVKTILRFAGRVSHRRNVRLPACLSVSLTQHTLVCVKSTQARITNCLLKKSTKESGSSLKSNWLIDPWATEICLLNKNDSTHSYSHTLCVHIMLPFLFSVYRLVLRFTYVKRLCTYIRQRSTMRRPRNVNTDSERMAQTEKGKMRTSNMNFI